MNSRRLDPMTVCFVPQCKNKLLMCPEKHFFHVPKSTKIEWCAAGNKPNVPKSAIYICEDHLNLQEDLLNYQDWKNNTVLRPRLKPQVPKTLKNIYVPLPSTSVVIYEDLVSSKAKLIEQTEKAVLCKPVQVNPTMVHRSVGVNERKRKWEDFKEDLLTLSPMGSTTEFTETGARGAGIDSSGEYSDFDDEQAEAAGGDVTSGGPIQEYQIEVDQNEVNYDVCKVETVEHTFDEEDRGTFVPATEHNMPEVNMFAVVEYICKHERGLKRLDYPKWKLLTKNNPNLISAIKVARTDDMCRLRGTVNFDRVNSHMCEVEYVVHTDTISSSECVCGNNPCEHVAAFLMWLAHKPTTNNTESEQVHTSSERDGPLLNELQPSDSLVEDVKPDVSDDVRPSTSRSDSNMEVVPQPPVKRQRMAAEVDVPVVSESLITVVPLPKDENEPDKSKIECTFRRQIVFDLWKSTTGSSSDRSDKIQATLKQQLQDDDYIIDFAPIQQRIEHLCLVFDIMKNVIDKSIFKEFMNTKEFIELERQARKRNSSVRDPLS